MLRTSSVSFCSGFSHEEQHTEEENWLTKNLGMDEVKAMCEKEKPDVLV